MAVTTPPLQESEREALLPCPFCGEAHDIEADSSNTNASTWVICHGCGSRSAIMKSSAKAIANWNTRAAAPVAQPSPEPAGLRSEPVAEVRSWNAGRPDAGVFIEWLKSPKEVPIGTKLFAAPLPEGPAVALLRRIRQWDALDTPDTDGAFWKREIDAVLLVPLVLES